MRQRLALASAVTALLAACGGGGSSGSPAAVAVATGAAATVYAQSLVVGLSSPQSVTYQAASGASQATVTVSTASTLLPVGTTLVLAEHVEPGLPGLRAICVSGNGETTNVVSGINLGVTTQGAALLLDSGWTATASPAAWAAAVRSGAAWSGWENCGAKLEGPPSRSSRLVPSSDGGYAEDVYDGNPGTNFRSVLHDVAATDVTAMVSPQGLLSTDDPQRPLLLTLRSYADTSGHVVFVETGLPATGAARGVTGFVALYVPGP